MFEHDFLAVVDGGVLGNGSGESGRQGSFRRPCAVGARPRLVLIVWYHGERRPRSVLKNPCLGEHVVSRTTICSSITLVYYYR